MKNTEKLEQFKEVTEAELQEIRGGEIRKENNFLFYFLHSIPEITCCRNYNYKNYNTYPSSFFYHNYFYNFLYY